MLNRLTIAFFILWTIGFIIPLPGDRGFFLDTYFPLPPETIMVAANKPTTARPAVALDERALYVQSIRKVYKMQVSKDFVDYIAETSNSYGLDYNLVIGLIAAESSFNPRAKSHVGAAGYAQVWAKWHQDKIAGRDIYNPRVNIEVAVRFLRECIDRFGSVYGGLKCYNGSDSKESADRYFNRVMGRKHVLQLTNLELAGI